MESADPSHLITNIIRQVFVYLPASVVKFKQYIRENNFVGDIIEAF